MISIMSMFDHSLRVLINAQHFARDTYHYQSEEAERVTDASAQAAIRAVEATLEASLREPFESDCMLVSQPNGSYFESLLQARAANEPPTVVCTVSFPDKDAAPETTQPAQAAGEEAAATPSNKADNNDDNVVVTETPMRFSKKHPPEAATTAPQPATRSFTPARSASSTGTDSTDKPASPTPSNTVDHIMTRVTERVRLRAEESA